MRTLTDHISSGLQSPLRITVLDEPGAGGACSGYKIDITGTGTVSELPAVAARKKAKTPGGTPGITTDQASTLITFQRGGIWEVGWNGITNEVLLAILIDRLRGFMSGPFPSSYTQIALTAVEDAMSALQHRTAERVTRGVAGTVTA